MPVTSSTHAPGPVEAGSVVPAGSGIGDQRRAQEVLRALERLGDAGELVPARHVGLEEHVPDPRGVGEQLAHGGPARRRAQPRLVAVVALEHLELAELGHDRGDLRVEVEPAPLHELEGPDRDERLGHRGEPEDRVRGHLVVTVDADPPGDPLVDDSVAVENGGGRPRHVTGGGRLAQQFIDPWSRSSRALPFRWWCARHPKPSAGRSGRPAPRRTGRRQGTRPAARRGRRSCPSRATR